MPRDYWKEEGKRMGGKWSNNLRAGGGEKRGKEELEKKFGRKGR